MRNHGPSSLHGGCIDYLRPQFFHLFSYSFGQLAPRTFYYHTSITRCCCESSTCSHPIGSFPHSYSQDFLPIKSSLNPTFNATQSKWALRPHVGICRSQGVLQELEVRSCKKEGAHCLVLGWGTCSCLFWRSWMVKCSSFIWFSLCRKSFCKIYVSSMAAGQTLQHLHFTLILETRNGFYNINFHMSDSNYRFKCIYLFSKYLLVAYYQGTGFDVENSLLKLQTCFLTRRLYSLVRS